MFLWSGGKARGKMTETQAKLAQLTAKRRLTVDKITVDVQVAACGAGISA
jgi:hypothetical protein